MLAQLVEDLVHLERGEDRLDQDGRLDRPLRHAEPLLRPDEDVVPEPRLEVRLELRQVEPACRRGRGCGRSRGRSRTGSPRSARRRPRSAAPPGASRAGARAGSRLLVQAVLLLAGVELDRAVERVRQVDLALDAVLPGRRVRVLEVGHEHLRARVERVDHHLPVDRAGDLDAAVLQLGRDRRDAPVALADVLRLGQEVGQLAVAQPLRPLVPRVEQLAPPRAEPALELGEELDCVVGEDALGAGRHAETLDRLALDDDELVRRRRSRSRLSLPSGKRTSSSETFVAAPSPKWARGSSEER